MSYIPATIHISLPLAPTQRAVVLRKQPISLINQNFLSARQPRDQGGAPRDNSVHASIQAKINKIINVLKDTTTYDWNVRVQWMKEAREIIDLMASQEDSNTGSVTRIVSSNTSRQESLSARASTGPNSHVTNLEELMRQLRYPLTAQILDQRSQVLKEACLLLSHLSRTLCQSHSKAPSHMLDRFIDYFLPKEGLFKVLHSGKSTLHELSHSCIKSIFTNLAQYLTQQTLLFKVLTLLADNLTSKSTQARVYISEYFSQCLIAQKLVVSQANEKNLSKVDSIINSLLQDASDAVRKNGKQSQKLYLQVYPNRVNNFTSPKQISRYSVAQATTRMNYHHQGQGNQISRAQSASTTNGRSQSRDFSALTSKSKRDYQISSNASVSPISARIFHTIQLQSSSRSSARPQTAVSHQKSRTFALANSSSGSVYGTISTIGSPSGSKTPTKLNEIKEVRPKSKKPTAQIQQAMPSPLNYALKILKSRKTFVYNTNNISMATSQSKDRKNKTLLSPQRQSPHKPAQAYAPVNTLRLQEKSMRVYESLRSPILSERTDTAIQGGVKSVDFSNASVTRTPINISIKIDTNRNQEEDSDVVKINNDDVISQGSSSHISRHSSPHSVSTNNKTLHQYLASMSPSPSRLKLKTQSSVTSTMLAASTTSKKTTPSCSNVLTPRTPIVQTIDQALKDAQSQLSTKRLHAFMNIQRYLQSENHSNFKMLAKDLQIMTRIVRQLAEGLGDQINQIAKIAANNLKEIAYQGQYHKLLETMLHQIIVKQMEIMSSHGDQQDPQTELQSLQQALIENFCPSALTISLLSVVDINRFIPDSSYMINIFEFISTIIQHIQTNEEQNQQQSESTSQIYDQLLLNTPLLEFIASSLILARPYQAENEEPMRFNMSNKQTLFRMSKTLLELLHCVSSQSAFTNAIQTQLSHKRLSLMIQVIELTDPDDIDPELFGLLHSVSLEAEPTPSLTYHSTQIKTSVGLPLVHYKLPAFSQNLESPPPSNREPTFFTLGGKLNESVASIDPYLIQGLQSSESQVRLAVVIKLASLRERLGEEKFLKATKGKLSITQQSLIKSLQERSKFKQADL